ncbi:MAG: HAD family phosphatase [Methylococcales bacterium]|nr:HAD family phosphatase [Methylococcales bacterium]
MIKALLLDFDGVIVDNEPSFIAAWQHAAQHLQLAWPWPEHALRGKSLAALQPLLLQQWRSQTALTTFLELSETFWLDQVARNGLDVMPGVAELLTWLAQTGMPYALASNSHTTAITRSLSYAGLAGRFPVMVGSDQVSAGKPSPEVFLRAAQILDVAIGDCLVVEDSATGLTAARHSGGKVAYVGPESQADSVLRKLSDWQYPDLTTLCLDLTVLT